jgi:Arc/MetJ-type ribon-helix-helix transcriptional regulator
VDKLSVSLPDDMATWLRRAAAKRYVSVSFLVKEALMPQFTTRHKK